MSDLEAALFVAAITARVLLASWQGKARVLPFDVIWQSVRRAFRMYEGSARC